MQHRGAAGRVLRLPTWFDAEQEADGAEVRQSAPGICDEQQKKTEDIRTESLPVARRQPARRVKVRHDVHTLSGAYAAHAVGAHDRAAFEAHLVGCESCRSEVAALRETAAELARLVETAPPPRLRMRVLAATARVRQLCATGIHTLGWRSKTTDGRGWSRRRRFPFG